MNDLLKNSKTKDELIKLGWDQLDIILISGDSYIDSPYIGIAVIGKYLLKNGFRVGIIAQPELKSEQDIMRLGEPKLFWGVSGGSVDSMVANYTATKKKRKSDDFTPGGINNRRPDRAVIVYSNLIRKYFKNTKPIVLGGIEASLRRVTHYDYWSDKIRKSILFDAKADALIYGMGEKTVLQLAKAFKQNEDWQKIKSLCYISDDIPNDYLELPSFDEVQQSKLQFTKMFHIFYKNNDPLTAKGLYQKSDTRYLIQNPPEPYLSQKEMDEIHESRDIDDLVRETLNLLDKKESRSAEKALRAGLVKALKQRGTQTRVNGPYEKRVCYLQELLELSNEDMAVLECFACYQTSELFESYCDSYPSTDWIALISVALDLPLTAVRKRVAKGGTLASKGLVELLQNRIETNDAVFEYLTGLSADFLSADEFSLMKQGAHFKKLFL